MSSKLLASPKVAGNLAKRTTSFVVRLNNSTLEGHKIESQRQLQDSAKTISINFKLLSWTWQMDH